MEITWQGICLAVGFVLFLLKPGFDKYWEERKAQQEARKREVV